MTEPIASGNKTQVELRLLQFPRPCDVSQVSSEGRPSAVAVQKIASDQYDEALIIPFNCDGAGRSPTVCRSKRAA